MSAVETNFDGVVGEPPAVAQYPRFSPRRRRWWLAAAGLLTLVAAVASVLLAKAAVYQPLA